VGGRSVSRLHPQLAPMGGAGRSCKRWAAQPDV